MTNYLTAKMHIPVENIGAPAATSGGIDFV